jgi:hypothetical protein
MDQGTIDLDASQHLVAQADAPATALNASSFRIERVKGHYICNGQLITHHHRRRQPVDHTSNAVACLSPDNAGTTGGNTRNCLSATAANRGWHTQRDLPEHSKSGLGSNIIMANSLALYSHNHDASSQNSSSTILALLTLLFSSTLQFYRPSLSSFGVPTMYRNHPLLRVNLLALIPSPASAQSCHPYQSNLPAPSSIESIFTHYDGLNSLKTTTSQTFKINLSFRRYHGRNRNC